MNRAEIRAVFKRREDRIPYRQFEYMDEEYTRNKIRHRVMPYLTEEINPRTVEHMAAAAQSLEEVQDYLDEMTEMLMEKYVQKSGDSLLADNQLAHEPLLLQKCVLQKCLEQSGTKDFTRVHLDEICTKRILPGGIWMKSCALFYQETEMPAPHGLYAFWITLQISPSSRRITSASSSPPPLSSTPSTCRRCVCMSLSLGRSPPRFSIFQNRCADRKPA